MRKCLSWTSCSLEQEEKESAWNAFPYSIDRPCSSADTADEEGSNCSNNRDEQTSCLPADGSMGPHAPHMANLPWECPTGRQRDWPRDYVTQ